MTAPRLHRVAVGPLQANCYLLVGDGPGVLVDCGAEADAIKAFVTEHAPDGVAAIITTHGHHDHVGALREVAVWADAVCFAAPGDLPTIARAAGTEVLPLADGSRTICGSVDVEAIHLSGHTPGGLALALPGMLLTGDSLFPGGVGKTSSPEDFTQLLDDVTTKLFDRFDDDIVVHPGHGEPTTLGAERPHLGEWRKRGW